MSTISTYQLYSHILVCIGIGSKSRSSSHQSQCASAAKPCKFPKGIPHLCFRLVLEDHRTTMAETEMHKILKEVLPHTNLEATQLKFQRQSIMTGTEYVGFPHTNSNFGTAVSTKLRLVAGGGELRYNPCSDQDRLVCLRLELMYFSI